jgi:hypothetical protein
MDWITSANGLITLIIGLFGLVSAGISLFALIKNLIKTSKDKTFQENWKLIMQIADKAMAAASETSLANTDKKTQVVEAVKAGCKAAGIDADSFMDQLSAYIDDCIAFAHSIKRQ